MEVLISPLKEFDKGKGYGFNAVLLRGDEPTQINGFRVFKIGFCPPGISYGRGRFYPSILFTREDALSIVKEVLRANPELEAYLNPGLQPDDVISAMVCDNSTFSKFNIPLSVTV